MFRIECFVEDKNLAKALHALNGIVLDLRTVPVANAAPAPDGDVIATTQGSTLDMLASWLAKKKVAQIKAKDAKQFQRDIGRSELGYSHTLRMAIDAKMLRKKGKGQTTLYEVVGGVK